MKCDIIITSRVLFLNYIHGFLIISWLIITTESGAQMSHKYTLNHTLDAIINNCIV